MPDPNKAAAISRSDRQQCWDARDAYFACLDKKKIKNPQVEDSSACSNIEFKSLCRQTWVEYFIARRLKTIQTEEYMNRGFVESKKPRTDEDLRRMVLKRSA
ncbi:cytochrome oxidase c subunit VIb-domain-containing protein [Lipomyces japonicus]|uniref:cytochrome oxidase c subunit VIb-domain-containing protein n=1 Tax=Lipomyces japonicus TaxID=56871 RepID=UPI0034CEB11A